MIPLLLILRKLKASYEWGKKEYKLNHLLFMDDLKLFSKSEEQIDTLMRTVNVFSNDIGMDFGIKKCGALHLKSDEDRLYIKRKEWGRGLMSVECCVRKEDNDLGFDVGSSEENLIEGVAAAETTNTEDTVTIGELKKIG